MSKFAIFAAAAFVLAAWHAPDAAAQGYLKAAPTEAPKGAAVAPAKDSAKGKTPTTTTKLCTPPGGGSPKPC